MSKSTSPTLSGIGQSKRKYNGKLVKEQIFYKKKFKKLKLRCQELMNALQNNYTIDISYNGVTQFRTKSQHRNFGTTTRPSKTRKH